MAQGHKRANVNNKQRLSVGLGSNGKKCLWTKSLWKNSKNRKVTLQKYENSGYEILCLG